MPSLGITAWLALAALVLALVLGALAGFGAHGLVDHAPGGVIEQLASARASYAKLTAEEASAEQRAKAIATRQAAIAAAAGAAEPASQTRIATVTRTIVKEVPLVLTPQIDRAYPLPVGFLRVHDAAARGLELSDTPDPAGRPDDAAGGVAASDAAAVIARNYGACRADAERLGALQAWLKADLAAATPPP